MTVALIVAAGSGERLGAGRPKALVALAGRPLLAWSVEALLALEEIERIVLALPAGVSAEAALGRAHARVGAVAGGDSRSESVARALAGAGSASGRADQLVLVHDAARPLLSAELARAVIAALAADRAAHGAIAAVPVADTVKRVDAAGAVLETLERSELWAVQTPQVFRRHALERALDVPAHELARATDDAWLVERAGGLVLVVPAGAENLKVTTPLDLRLAELLLRERRASARPEGPDRLGGPARTEAPARPQRPDRLGGRARPEGPADPA
ncbi:MAG TPA: 2-C-methyl-D-erythritol 4-phosphate cytidylyltransferase [Solirubrobacteraceae bacterium]|nr:2-C-methyl-D-erythritol 4-phosphate cytidylyltransferase [Solirubrobacteraceae bacterium]